MGLSDLIDLAVIGSGLVSFPVKVTIHQETDDDSAHPIIPDRL
jgi:hypothetical protein